MGRRSIRWLIGELPGLVARGVIDDATSERLRAHYHEASEGQGRRIALAVCAVFGALLIGFSLTFSGEGFREPAAVAVTFPLPVMIKEGIITGFCIAFLRKVKPEILNVSAGMIKEGKKL